MIKSKLNSPKLESEQGISWIFQSIWKSISDFIFITKMTNLHNTSFSMGSIFYNSLEIMPCSVYIYRYGFKFHIQVVSHLMDEEVEIRIVCVASTFFPVIEKIINPHRNDKISPLMIGADLQFEDIH